jgi:hypothetical protein
MELIHSDSNPRFDMCVIFTANYSFSVRRRPVDGETFLMPDFMNLKIKSAQSFRNAHRDMMYVCIFIEVSTHTCMNTYIYTMFLKK